MDKKVSQMAPVGTLTGDELVMLVVAGVGNYQIPVSALLTGLSQMPVTAEQIGLGNVDNTADLDKPVSTAVQALLDGLSQALVAKAEVLHQHAIDDVTGLQAILTDLVTVTVLADGLSGKANTTHQHATSDLTDLATALADYVTAAALTQALASKADTAHSHTATDITDLTIVLGDYATVASLTQALATKADAVHQHAITDIVDLETTLSSLSTALSGKADTAHTHVSADITDLTAAIKALTLPLYVAVISNLLNVSADIQVGFSTTNGYDMGTVTVNGRYKLATDTTWTDLVGQPFTGGQLNYVFNLTGLIASSNYDYEVFLTDTNSVAIVATNVGTFTTPA